jgi:Zn-dependent protease with chaperone function
LQLYPILLVAVVMAADAGLDGWAQQLHVPPAVGAMVAIVPVMLAMAVAWLVTNLCLRRAARGAGPMTLLAAGNVAVALRAFIILNHAVAVLAAGWLIAVRSWVGNLVLVDELIAISPALLGLLTSWWIDYPIVQRMREATLIRRLDLGQPVYALPSRGRYVLLQARMHLFILLVPMLLIAALAELLEDQLPSFLARVGVQEAPAWFGAALSFAVALLVFLLAPLLAQAVLGLRPLPSGPLRDDMLAVCARHRVRVSRIMLWNTSGMVLNAAVIGLVAPLRYVLLSDALLESMTRAQLRAVMAHEVGHVRLHHMPWMIVGLLACLSLASLVIQLPLMTLDRNTLVDLNNGDALPLAAFASELALGLALFGWVSRRFERQADTFAVKHLSMVEHSDEIEAASTPQVSPNAVAAMDGALDAIARLNGIPQHRPSWRHGSIAWRRAHLRSILGRPIDRLPIDRQMRWIKLAAALIVAGSIVLTFIGAGAS